MKNVIRFFVLLIASGIVASCEHSVMMQQQGGKTLQLSARTIELSPSATSASVSANLSCGCPFRMESMRCWGDTNAIHFNLETLAADRNNQQIVATAIPEHMGEATHLSTCLSFVVNDRMMNIMCMDTVTVHYTK